MSETVGRAVRIVSLILALLVGSFVFLVSVLGLVPVITTPFDQYWNGQAETTHGPPLISSDAELVAPRALQAVAELMNSLIGLLGGLVLLLVAGRLLARSSFTALVRWGLVALGVLVMLKAAVAPQLKVLAVDLALLELGYPIASRDGSGGYFETDPQQFYLGLWDPFWTLNRVEIVLFLLGATIAVLGFMVADGMRLRRGAVSPSDIR